MTDPRAARWRSNAAASIIITVNGAPLAAQAGDSVASALIARGITTLRRGPGGEPRGVFCGIGLCFDCLVAIDGQPGRRACMTPVRAGMRIELPVP